MTVSTTFINKGEKRAMNKSNADVENLRIYLHKNMSMLLGHNYLHEKETNTLKVPQQTKKEYIGYWSSLYAWGLCHGNNEKAITTAYNLRIRKKITISLIKDMDKIMEEIIKKVYGK